MSVVGWASAWLICSVVVALMFGAWIGVGPDQTISTERVSSADSDGSAAPS